MPFKQNINWVAAGAAVTTLFAYFFPGLPENVRDSFLTLALVGVILIVPYLHTFVNHPDNKKAAADLAAKAVAAAKNIAPIFVACLFVVSASLSLSACASAQPSSSPSSAAPASPDPMTQISQFTVADLQAADADAVANNDTIAHACYPALIRFIQSLPASNGTVAGAFSAFQKARDIRNSVAAGIPTYLTMGCGPLYAQVHGDLLAAIAGGFAGQAIVTVATTP